MTNIDENKKKVVQILFSQQYEIDVKDSAILASKYCERQKGGLICLLLESTPPYKEITTWGETAGLVDDSDIKDTVRFLNENLTGLIKGKNIT
jgi:hypothetical protein